MKNINIVTKDNEMTITIKLSERYGRSKSGKTEIIATTEGNAYQFTNDKGERVYVGINCYAIPPR